MQTLEMMEEADDVSPKVSLRRNGSFICVAAPFLYDKLPEEPLKLTILKLDGSSFDIQVNKNGTVEDLKQAVEEAFSNCKVSWIHVWGHFCLSYCGQKLLADNDLIGTCGIKDGDELSFVRHVYTGYNPVKTQSESEEHHLDESRIFHGFNDKKKKGEEEENHDQDNSENDEDSTSEDENNEGVLTSCQYRLFHLFKGWFSYQKLADSERRVEQKMK